MNHPDDDLFRKDLNCTKMLDHFSVFRHMTVVHGSTDRKLSSLKKRRNELNCKAKKREKFPVKKDESEYESEYSSEENEIAQKLRRRSKIKSNERKHETPKRRPNNRHRPQKQTLYGSELDSPEKLYAEEINGTSIFTCALHLNIFLHTELPNGEVSDELATSQGINLLRWRDLLVCSICKVRFININALTDHIAINHGTRTRAFGCYNCEIDYGALYESSLVNHLVERHYHEHLKLCCLVCKTILLFSSNFNILLF